MVFETSRKYADAICEEGSRYCVSGHPAVLFAPVTKREKFGWIDSQGGQIREPIHHFPSGNPLQDLLKCLCKQ
jgi:hypothetical protein